MGEYDELWAALDTEQDDQAQMIQEMESLADAAYSYYKLDQYAEAFSLYRKAFEIASSIRNQEKMSKYKYWEGGCLYFFDRYREALVALLQLSQLERGIPSYQVRGLIRQITIAIILPIDLIKIQNLIKTAYDMARQHGLQSYAQSCILLEESALASVRYDDIEELAKAQEALACFNKDDMWLILGVYYSSLMDCFVKLRRLNDLKTWLIKLEELGSEFPVDKELRILKFQAEIALLEGNPKAAWNFAERRLFRERETSSNCWGSLNQLIRMGIKAGKLDVLPGYLMELGRLRHSECSNDRYVIQMRFGDYCAALYKRERKKLFGSKEKAAHYLSTARRFYDRALRMGTEIDSLLHCDGRQMEIKVRLAELDS